jgi:hypothetical protein
LDLLDEIGSVEGWAEMALGLEVAGLGATMRIGIGTAVTIGIDVQVSAGGSEMAAVVDGILLGQNDEWAVLCSRYTTLESFTPVSNDPFVRLPAVAAGPIRPKLDIAVITPP